ncbi:MAG: threonine--tRNA ligase [Polyangiaceae bacterium]|nr:threonine--tRNA ligase [Polyangiaceae bacterium]
MQRPERLTPRALLQERGVDLRDVVAVRAGGRVVDLHTPVDPGVELEPIRAADPAALAVLRHSAAHVMADVVQRLYPGTQVTIGPAIDSGFYYDFDRPDGAFTERDLARIEKEMRALVKRDVPFVREEVDRDRARELFAGMGERYKVEILESIPAGEAISLYRHGAPESKAGTWVDLCEGPHVPSTRFLGAVKLTSVAGAYWRGDERRPMLQRIYGTAFPTEEALAEHLARLEEAQRRDHRKLGKELELFLFHEWAPAMPFFLPRGAHVYHSLIDWIRGLYRQHGYAEVITPQIFDRRLFATSGHLENYRENMYLPTTGDAIDAARGRLDAALAAPDEPALRERAARVLLERDHPAFEQLAQKPMNCPSHCLLFAHRRRSYRELPWRVADFGRLHRYERGGVVHGLARVRSFCQDDAHIFCTPEQIADEVRAFDELLFGVYRAFGFDRVAVKLALRPEQRVGTDELWDRAEQVLEQVLTETGVPFEKLPGEGAFYGPKLEFHVTDAIGRSWQLGTIQLDYALPERFGLEYVGTDGAAHRPVMLHRAILGSVERFLGIYLEHVAGKLPVWLAPEQARIVTVSEKHAEYAALARDELVARGLRVGLDAGADKLGAKIREARLARLPYLAVVGDDEVRDGTLTPRAREEGDLPAMTRAAFAELLLTQAEPPRPAPRP